MKKGNAVVFGLTADHVFAVASVMMDLKRYSANVVDEVVIIHDGIGGRDQKLLNTILPSRFIPYDFPIHSTKVKNASAIQYFSKMVFSKYECLRLLEDYKSVMWLDYDMVLQGDIAELFSPCESGIKMMPGGLPVRGQLLTGVAEYNMDAEGICSCVFVLHDNLDSYRKLCDFCYEKTERYAAQLYMPEQAIFDFMIQEFGLSIVPIDRFVYSVHPTDTLHASNAKILHAYGQPKFWNGLRNDQWNANYQAWRNMGGTRHNRLTSFANKLIKRSGNTLRRFARLS